MNIIEKNMGGQTNDSWPMERRKLSQHFSFPMPSLGTGDGRVRLKTIGQQLLGLVTEFVSAPYRGNGDVLQKVRDFACERMNPNTSNITVSSEPGILQKLRP